jgi:hypothetical protein
VTIAGDGRAAPEEAVLAQYANEVAAVLAGRALTAAQLLTAVATLRRRVRHPSVLLAGASAILAQSLWSARRARSMGRVRDRTAGWSDVAGCIGGLAVEAASWETRDIAPDPRWSLPFSVVVSAWLPFELEPAQLSLAGVGWAMAYGATTRNRAPSRTVGTVPGQRLGEVTAPGACSLVCRRFASHLRRQASQLDRGRAAAADYAERLAQEEERNRQYRVAHDSAVQVLEAVAGAWDLDEEVLLARIDYEIRRLNRVLAGGGLVEGGSLVDGLTSLQEEFGLSGLSIALDLAGLTTMPTVTTTQAFCEATHEALVNIRKHAGVNVAQIVAASSAHEVTVTIIDTGSGFDVSLPRSGFGLAESVSGRMESVGGRIELASAIGKGTSVRLSAPC